MAFNRIQFQHGMSIPEFLDSFGTEARCAEAVKAARWPSGFGSSHGFSLHAAVRCGADDRQSLEQLCRYITRPALQAARHKQSTGLFVSGLGTGQRTRTNQRRWPGRAEAEDPLARRHQPLGDVAAGVHAAAGCAGATPTAAPDPFGVRVTSLREVSEPPLREPRRAGTERQVARAGGAARGRGARADCATRRLRGELCAPPAGAAELDKATQACLSCDIT